MTPDQIVSDFASKAAECLDWVIAHFVGTDRILPDQPLMLFPLDGGPGVRTGSMDSLGTFSMHGAGCRFELASGEDVDVDWDTDGRPVFDSWRLLMFARSIGESAVTEKALKEAAEQSPRLVRVRCGWFTWSDPPYVAYSGGHTA